MTTAQAGRRNFPTGRSILFSTGLVLAFFGIVEAALAWIDPRPPVRPGLILRAIDIDIEFPFMRADPELFWKPRPGFRGEFLGETVTINALGMRGPELRVPRPTGSRRILCFGDSITFGYGVGDDDTYPAFLGRALAERGVEVANAGVTGYTSHQVLVRFEHLATQAGADIVTFSIGWNDGTRRPVEDRVYAQRLQATRSIEGVLDGWRLYRLLNGLYVRSLFRAEKEARTREHARVPLDQYRENLESLVSGSRSRGVTPVFVRFPHRRLPEEPPTATPYEPVMLEVAQRLDVPVMSVGRLGLDGTEQDTGHLFIDSLHLSTEGNGVMSDLLARQLVALDIV